jgi:membrane dipeptidase
MIDTVKHDIIDKYPNDFMFATSVKDIEEAHRRGKIAALMGIEGGHAIEDSLRLLRDYYAMGIRYMTLTHTNTNHWADSSGDITRTDVQHHNGLTPFGKDVVREMNRIGMLVDISHVSDKTFWDALEVSKAPIFASHSDARALANAPRNMTDDMIVALAKNGGVVDINFNCGFLSQRYRDEVSAKSAQIAARLKQATSQSTGGKNLGELETDQLEGKMIAELGIKPATLADVVAHIDHVRKIAGIDAIGIGTDFNGVECVPQGLEDSSKFPNLTRALLEKGYTSEDIHKIYSGNLLRVMRAAEMAASK